MTDCLVALGSNLGDRRQTLERAVARLAEVPGVRLISCSSFHGTAPVGGPADQEEFLNAAVRLETALDAHRLLAALQEIERSLGRQRQVRWGPRSLDLDLLLFGDRVIRTPQLEVPHPRMSFRRFVLKPAAEVAAEMVHPTIGWTVGQLLAHVENAPHYVAITGPIAAGKTWLVDQLEQHSGAVAVRENLEAIELDAFYGDPAGHAWETEIRFLGQRREQLARGGPAGAAAARGRLVVSDYWFDQSLVYPSVWLGPQQRAAFEPLWREAAAEILRPRLLIVLDGPDALLRRRIVDRGRPYEQDLAPVQLEQLHESLERHLAAGGHGPVLRLDASRPETVLCEAQAAILAMQ